MADDDLDPWAPGGAMSTGWSSGRSESDRRSSAFEHARPERLDPQPAAPSTPDGFSPVEQQLASTARTAESTQYEKRGGRWIPFGVVLAVIVAVAGVVSYRGDNTGDNSDAEDSAAEVTEPTVVVQLPEDLAAVANDAADTDQTPATTVSGDAVRDESTGFEASSSEREAEPTVAEAGVVSEFVIDIAPALSDIAPTEVVGLTPDGELFEISVASGRVRRTIVPGLSPLAQVSTTDFGALVRPTETGFEIVHVDAELSGRFEGTLARVTSTPTLDRFYVWSQRSPSSAPLPPSILDARGEAIESQPAEWPQFDDDVELIDSAGGFIQSDTGGTFVTNADGVRRITTGDVVATGRNHVLVRECNDRRECALTSLSATGSRTLFRADLPDDVAAIRMAGLSPTGTSLMVLSGRNAADDPPVLSLLDLVTGSIQFVDASTSFQEISASWAIDGSGIFYAGPRLSFFDRSTAETTLVSAQLAPLTSVTTRQPRWPAACELLSFVQPGFAAMRAAGNDAIAPPDVDIIDKLVAQLPPPIAVEVQPTATFVRAFVDETSPGTQTIANWPVDVQAGLEALESFAAERCGVKSS